MNTTKIRRYKKPQNFHMETSKHMMERIERLYIAKELGKFKIDEMFYVDRNHPDGAEIHIVTSTGLVIILNAKTFKFVTLLIARVSQIKRYYRACGEKAPKYILDLADEHKLMNLNNL